MFSGIGMLVSFPGLVGSRFPLHSLRASSKAKKGACGLKLARWGTGSP